MEVYTNQREYSHWPVHPIKHTMEDLVALCNIVFISDTSHMNVDFAAEVSSDAPI